jgi:archaellum biogenesis protein FlaJ (TadC family)
VKKEVTTSQFIGEMHGLTASMTFMITRRLKIVEVFSQRTVQKKEVIL